MAIFKLGAIITEVAGSIGGTTFRRGFSNLVASNKSFGASKTKLLLNPRLGAIRSVFSAWQFLTQTQRDMWIAAALNYQFPDKFGSQKYLTGYQLFVKLNVQLIPSAVYHPDTTGIQSAVPTLVLNSAQIDISAGGVGINISGIPPVAFILVSVEASPNPINSVSFIDREIIFSYFAVNNGASVFSTEFFAKYPWFGINDYARVFVTPMNAWGFKGTTVSLPFDVVP